MELNRNSTGLGFSLTRKGKRKREMDCSENLLCVRYCAGKFTCVISYDYRKTFRSVLLSSFCGIGHETKSQRLKDISKFTHRREQGGFELRSLCSNAKEPVCLGYIVTGGGDFVGITNLPSCRRMHFYFCCCFWSLRNCIVLLI